MPDQLNCRILIIDDENSIRESLSAYLEDFDFKVNTAKTAEEALKLFKEKQFDVGIVDLRLPEMSGEDFIIKAKAKAPNMMFLIYTGSTDYILSNRLKQIGMSNEKVFFKPLTNLNIIVESIEKMMQSDIHPDPANE